MLFAQTFAVSALAIAMVGPAFGTALIAGAGGTASVVVAPVAAGGGAVALTMIATATEIEELLTIGASTAALPQGDQVGINGLGRRTSSVLGDWTRGRRYVTLKDDSV